MTESFEGSREDKPPMSRRLFMGLAGAAAADAILPNKARANEPSDSIVPKPRIKGPEGETTRKAMIARMRQDLDKQTEYMGIAVGKLKEGRWIIYHKGAEFSVPLTPLRIGVEVYQRSTPEELARGVEVNHTHPRYQGEKYFTTRYRDTELDLNIESHRAACAFFEIPSPGDVAVAKSDATEMYLASKGIKSGPVEHGAISHVGRWGLRKLPPVHNEFSRLRETLVSELTELFVKYPSNLNTIRESREINRVWEISDVRQLARVFALLIVDREINISSSAIYEFREIPEVNALWKRIQEFYSKEEDRTNRLKGLHMTLANQIVHSGMKLKEAVRIYNEALRKDMNIDMYFEPFQK